MTRRDWRCPLCRGRVDVRWTFTDVRILMDPPRQWERYKRHVKWQCLERIDHDGYYTEPADEQTPPAGEIFGGRGAS